MNKANLNKATRLFTRSIELKESGFAHYQLSNLYFSKDYQSKIGKEHLNSAIKLLSNSKTIPSRLIAIKSIQNRCHRQVIHPPAHLAKMDESMSYEQFTENLKRYNELNEKADEKTRNCQEKYNNSLNTLIKENPTPELYILRASISTNQSWKSDLQKAADLGHINAYFMRGMKLEALDPNSAIKDLTKFINISNNRSGLIADSYTTRARIYAEQRKLDLALDDLTSAIESITKHQDHVRETFPELDNLSEGSNNIKKVNLFLTRARLHQLKGNYMSALSDYSQAILISEKDPVTTGFITVAREGRARIYTKLGDLKKACLERRLIYKNKKFNC